MIAIFKHISSTIEAGKRMLKLNGYGNYDPRTASECAPSGTDSSPTEGMQAIYADTTNVSNPVIIGYINTKQLAAAGEHRIYATDANGVFKFNIWQRADGTVLIGSSDAPADYVNFLVKYNELKIGFDLLKTEVNAMVTIFNAHVHPGVTPGVGATLVSATPATPATATIDSSKATKIKTI